MADHVEKLESGGAVCRHCGGMVDAEGYSLGSDVDDTEEVNVLNNNDDDSATTAQHESTTLLRRAGRTGFADAMRRRGRD